MRAGYSTERCAVEAALFVRPIVLDQSFNRVPQHRVFECRGCALLVIQLLVD